MMEIAAIVLVLLIVTVFLDGFKPKKPPATKEEKAADSIFQSLDKGVQDALVKRAQKAKRR